VIRPSELWRRVVFLIRGTKASGDLDDEIRTHLELRERKLRDQGLDSKAARDEARRLFGNRTQAAETSRDAWNFRRLSDLARDVRVAGRSLRRRPGFALTAVFSLAVTLGANTAVFWFVRAIVVQQFPAPGAKRFVIIRQHNEQFHMENCCFQFRFYEQLRKQDIGLEDVTALTQVDVKFTDGEQTENLKAEIVSDNYFRFLGASPAAGRLEDLGNERSSPSNCVISYRLWQERYGGDPTAIGRQVFINGVPLRIAGVTDHGFRGASLYSATDIQLPTAMTLSLFGGDRDSMAWVQLLGRMRAGVTPAQVLPRLNIVGLAIERAAGMLRFSERDTFILHDGGQGFDSKKDRFGKAVLLLLGLVGLVLLIACANLSALLIVRNVGRATEAGVRLALGGSRGALVRHFLAESLVLAGAGGVLGFGFAVMLTTILLKLLGPDGEGLGYYVWPDAQAFLFTAVVTLGACLLFGLLPAYSAAQIDPMPAIRGISSATLGRRSLVSTGLIVVQIALSIALLFGAGLFVRTLHNLRSIDLGFNPEKIALLHLDAGGTARGNAPGPFYEELLRHVRALPGTRAASLSNLSVLSGEMQSIVLRVPGFSQASGLAPTTYFMNISDGYFRTLGIPLLQGRDFTDIDRGAGDGAQGLVIVNETFERRFLGGQGMGMVFAYGGGRQVRVVGIVSQSHFRGLKEDPQPIMYLPITHDAFPDALYLQVRAEGERAATVGRLRALIREVDSRVPVDHVTTMETQIDAAVTRERLLAFLSTFVGGIAAALAAIGVYGVMSFSMARRTREIGIRLAVGAERWRIFAQTLQESVAALIAGVVLGVPLALGLGGLAANLLFGLKPVDPLMIIAAVVVIGLTAMIAAAVPAWRAARLDVMHALRWE
jgi:predicted permease